VTSVCPALAGPLAWTEPKEIKVLQDNWDPEVCPDQQLARVTVDIQAIPAPKEIQDRLGVMEHQVLKVIQVCPASVDQASKEKREHVACPVHPACQDLTGRRAMQVFQDFQA